MKKTAGPADIRLLFKIAYWIEYKIKIPSIQNILEIQLRLVTTVIKSVVTDAQAHVQLKQDTPVQVFHLYAKQHVEIAKLQEQRNAMMDQTMELAVQLDAQGGQQATLALQDRHQQQVLALPVLLVQLLHGYQYQEVVAEEAVHLHLDQVVQLQPQYVEME